MKKSLLLVLMLFSVLFSAMAQEITVSGTVQDADGSPLPTATIAIKGTTTGTVSDIDGKYSLKVPSAESVLVFSFVGYTTKEITVGTQSVIDVILESDMLLEEVVVTALGTKQNAKSVTYANQSVKASELMTTPNKNALSALRGKTAGVKITANSGSVGASNRIVLRGESSLTGDNNALIVVDGIPIDNGTSSGGAGGGESGYADFGNRFNDFDPDNIESLVILKGPSATSLYGSRGASGVILITTKTGNTGGVKVNINSTSSVESAYILMQRQDRWGQGYTNPDGSKSRDSGENWSWGPEFDGVVRPWTSPVDTDGDGTLEYLSRPYSAVDNQLENFFRSGYTLKNSVSISGGNKMYQYYASYGNTKQSGVLDNTDYLRNNFTFNSSANFNEKLSSSLKLTYSNIDQNTAQEGSRAFEGQNAYAAALQAPNTIPYNELRDYNNPFHSFKGYYGSYTTNPYFILNEFTNNAKINNFLASANITYKPIENMTIQSRGGINYVNTKTLVVVPQYAYEDHLIWEDNLSLSERDGRQVSAGSVSIADFNSRVIDWNNTISYNWKINDDFGLTPVIGMNYYDVQVRGLSGSTVGGLVIPGIYNLNNSVSQATVGQIENNRRILGAYANLAFDWQDKVFLNYSARNDWSSTLPAGSQSFGYQAIGVSAILSEILDMSSTPVDYLKVRASIGTTGKDASPYLLTSTFNVNPDFAAFGDIYTINAPFNGQTGISRGGLIGNNTLTPERTTSRELGLDVEFLKGRITASYTYYNNTSAEQIVNIALSPASGYSSTAANVGEMVNRGHELTVSAVPVVTTNFKWKMDFTWSRNVNEVVKISDQTDELTIYSSGRGVTLVAEEGQPFGTWKSAVPRYSPNGSPIVDATTGLPTYTDEVQTIGAVQPDWIGGLVNTISYKGLSLTAVFDTRQGGEIFSLTQAATEFNGTAMTTAVNNRDNLVIPNSVVENTDGSFSPNTVAATIFDITNDGNYGRRVLDGSFIKLRELSLGYSIPKKVLKGLKIQNASVNFFVQNVKFWLPSENTFADPEVNGPSSITSNVTGVETTQTPPSRSFGINLNITL